MQSKTILIALCTILITACAQKEDLSTTIYSFDAATMSNEHCGSGYRVYDYVESDSYYQRELEKYMYKAFIDNDICEQISPKIFNRPSFTMLILELFSEKENLKAFPQMEKKRDSYIALLHNCTNEKVYYALCDSLLKRNIDDGLTALWGKDPKQLKQLNAYIKRNKNVSTLTQAIAMYHNAGMKREKEEAVVALQQLDKPQTKRFLEAIENSETIDYQDYSKMIGNSLR